jgi:hypothetical protein
VTCQLLVISMHHHWRIALLGPEWVNSLSKYSHPKTGNTVTGISTNDLLTEKER